MPHRTGWGEATGDAIIIPRPIPPRTWTNALYSTFNKLNDTYITFAKTETRHLIKNKKLNTKQYLDNCWFERLPSKPKTYLNVVKYGSH